MSIVRWLKSLLVRSSENTNSEKSAVDSTPLDFTLPAKQPEINSTKQEGDNRIEDFGRKAVDFVQETGKEITDQGTAVWNEVKEKLNDLDEGTKEFREKIKNKASEALEKMDDFVDQTLEKAKSLQEKEDKIDQDKDGFADKKVDFGPPMTEKQGGFFEKAEQWVNQHDGSKHSDTVQENKTENNEPNRPTLDLPKE